MPQVHNYGLLYGKGLFLFKSGHILPCLALSRFVSGPIKLKRNKVGLQVPRTYIKNVLEEWAKCRLSCLAFFIEFTELVVVGIAAPERIERPLFTWGD